MDVWLDYQNLAEAVVPRPLSLSISSNDPEEMIEEALLLSALGPHIYIKIPVVGAKGESFLPIIHRAAQQGLKVNMTCCFSVSQSLLAAKAGAKAVSIFVGKIEDEGGNASDVLDTFAASLEKSKCHTQVLAACIRSVSDVTRALTTGAEIITIPPTIIDKMLIHSNAANTVGEFEDAVPPALQRPSELRGQDRGTH